jgi:hypothetical protein
MRLIRPAQPRHATRNAVILPLLMLLVGCIALVLMALMPPARIVPIALLGISAALGLGIGSISTVRAFSAGRRRSEQAGEDLARVLAPAFDDSYILILAPRLPAVPNDLAALLVGPPGVRAILARRWHGRYRVRGRGWEYDTRSSAGWIPCVTNPSFEGDTVTAAVARWAQGSLGEVALPVAPAIAFPRTYSTIILEEPEGEIVTTDNAPWWAQRIGRVQRMDPPRVARFVEAVMAASEAPTDERRTAASPRVA